MNLYFGTYLQLKEDGRTKKEWEVKKGEELHNVAK